MDWILEKLYGKKELVILICMIVFMIIPLFTEIYHEVFYRITIFILFISLLLFFIITVDQEEKFYKKWKIARNRNKLIYVIKTGSIWAVFQILGAFFSKYIINNYTPFYVYSKTPLGFIIFYILFIFFLGFMVGIISWGGNERKYEKIYNTRRLREKQDLIECNENH